MKRTLFPSIMLVLLLAAGCAAPAGDSPSAATLPASPTVPTLTPTPAPSPTPLPVLPEGWSEAASESPALGCYLPPGWEMVPRDAFTLDLRQQVGDGWLEIALITPDTAHLHGLDPAAGLTAAAIFAQLAPAFAEDGVFGTPEVAWPYYAKGLMTLTGTDGVYGEALFVAVVEREADALLVIGHKGEGDWAEFEAIYRVIAASLR